MDYEGLVKSVTVTNQKPQEDKKALREKIERQQRDFLRKGGVVEAIGTIRHAPPVRDINDNYGRGREILRRKREAEKVRQLKTLLAREDMTHGDREDEPGYSEAPDSPVLPAEHDAFHETNPPWDA